MDFALNEDQATLQQVLRGLFSTKSSEGAVRDQMDEPTAFDRSLWTQMAGQLGLHGLAIPEEYGGGGFGFVELGVVLQEMGYALVVSPFFASCVMSAQLLLAHDDEQARKELLPGIASGEVIATVALAESTGSWSTSDVGTTAQQTAAGWRLRGEKLYVLDGVVADLVLVVARAGQDVGVFAVDARATGLIREPLHTMDQTRKQARLSFEDTPARLVGSLDGAQAAVSTMLDRCAIALAAEAVGGTQKVLDMAVAYAKVREQFGRPIGSFQAVKHKCAAMLVDLEAARSAAYYALWAASVDSDDVPVVASLAKAFCVDAFLAACGQNIQIHGGIGFTWEHPAHLYLKRAKNSQQLLGSSEEHLQQLADRVGV